MHYLTPLSRPLLVVFATFCVPACGQAASTGRSEPPSSDGHGGSSASGRDGAGNGPLDDADSGAPSVDGTGGGNTAGGGSGGRASSGLGGAHGGGAPAEPDDAGAGGTPNAGVGGGLGAAGAVPNETGGAQGTAGSGTQDATYDGDWSGETSQGKPIVFRVNGPALTLLRFGYSGSAGGCSVSGTLESTAATALTSDGFSASYSSATLDYDVVGSFGTIASAMGTLSFTSRAAPGQPSCTVSGAATWTAAKLATGPSLDGTWTGLAADDTPVSLTVTNNQIVAISFAYAVDSTGCHLADTFSGPVSPPAAIAAGMGDFEGNQGALDYNGSVTFNTDGDATGSLLFFYFDTTGSPPCAGSTTRTFDVHRQ